ncbi:MAG: hypothetical protein J2P13_04785 [Acidobacteria bacterium]|nr:hypothetical protein [Acidobacteriota bacterium]
MFLPLSGKALPGLSARKGTQGERLLAREKLHRVPHPVDVQIAEKGVQPEKGKYAGEAATPMFAPAMPASIRRVYSRTPASF